MRTLRATDAGAHDCLWVTRAGRAGLCHSVRMPRGHQALPAELGREFSVADALRAGVGVGRIRGRDLERPFHGVRQKRAVEQAVSDPFERGREEELRLASAYATRMREVEFFSHETAAFLWGAPLPMVSGAGIHVAVHVPNAQPRAAGVIGHRLSPSLVTVTARNGLRLSSPASTWALLGHLAVNDLVALGDYFVRVWRDEGYFRVNRGRPPLATIAQLEAAIAAGRRAGGANLARAMPLIREDSWSRPESLTRCHLVAAGLPEPVLNRDFFDDLGVHLACIDLSYPSCKIAVEYQSELHSARYVKDIERIERLRAHGWIVIQVTSELLDNPGELVRRVRAALLSRGWRG